MDQYADNYVSLVEQIEKDPISNSRLLVEALREVLLDTHAEDLQRFLAVLESIAALQEPYIRYNVIDQIPKLAVVCDQNEMENIVDRHLLPIVLQSLTDADGQVRKAGHSSLLVMLEQDMLSQKVVEESVCPSVVAMTNYRQADGISLMGKLAQLLGKELTVSLFLDKFAQCCSDIIPAVREACAKNFGGICAVLGSELSTSKMVPLFCHLCDDECGIVRRACAEVFILVSSAVPLETRRTELTPRFLELLSDFEDRVSAMAFQVLGAFICTFAEPSVTGIAYDPCGELVFVGPECSEFRIVHQQNLPPRPDISGGHDSSSLTFSANNSTDKDNKTDEEDDAYNTFQFWQLPILNLEVVLEDEEIQANLASLDSELTSLSEKLDKCSSKDLGNADESVISDVSTPDSGWDSGANTPLQPQTPFMLRMSSSYEGDNAGKFSPPSADNSKPAQSVVPQPLLDNFLGMPNHDLHGDLCKECVLYCAYFLPGVASTIGPKNWPWIVDLYRNCALDRQWKVRKTVAASLHKMSMILGSTIANRDLAPILKMLLRDLDEVRMGALKNLANTLETFNASVRESFLPLLRDFLCLGSPTDLDRNWRFRWELAAQLAQSCRLFSPDHVALYFGQPVLALLKDKIAAVRIKAVELMGKVIENLSKDPKLLAAIMEFILEEIAYSDYWTDRMVFTLICAEVTAKNLLPCDEFCTCLLPQLLKFGKDNVPNVRICVARCIASSILSSGFLTSDHSNFEEVSAVLEVLKKDADRDVQEAALLNNAAVKIQDDD